MSTELREKGKSDRRVVDLMVIIWFFRSWFYPKFLYLSFSFDGSLFSALSCNLEGNAKRLEKWWEERYDFQRNNQRLGLKLPT